MEETIKPGMMLIAEGATFPEHLSLETEAYVPGWRLLKNLDTKGFDRIISQAGWNFFYLAGAVEMSAFGSDPQKTTRKAIKKAIAKLGSKNFNCLEITQLAAKRKLGLPFLNLSAHSRHFQKSILLFADREPEEQNGGSLTAV